MGGSLGGAAAGGASESARAVIESVAWDVLRVMEVVTVGRLGWLERGGGDPGRRGLGVAGLGRRAHRRLGRPGHPSPLG